MEIFKEPLNIEQIEKIKIGILKGKIIVFPTETVYGIGTNAFNEKSCEKIYKIKKRPLNKSLIVLISNIEMLQNIVEKPDKISKQLMNRFWPGNLTIIFKKKKNSKLASIITNNDEVAVRMTSSKLLLDILNHINVPIVAPSANITGKETGTKINKIIKDLKDADYIINAGDITSSETSTIVKVVDNKIKILREGKIKKEELKKVANID